MTPQAEEYLPPLETHLVTSKHVAQTFKVQVMRPTRRRGDTTRFPVVYATDGNLTFDMLKGISYLIQGSGYDAPRFILVGIGYPGESPAAGAVLRARDLIFPGYPQISTRPPPVEGVMRAQEGAQDFGGAEHYQHFIAQELIPLIDASYESLAGDRTYFGHSAGAGFGLFTLFTRTELFRNYIVSSPGLTYHGTSSAGIHYENYDFLPQMARTFISSRKTIGDVRVYMSVGGAEELEPPLAQWRMTSSFYQMAALLKAADIPGLSVTTEVFAGETHATVWPMAFIHGIQAVFESGVGRIRRE